MKFRSLALLAVLILFVACVPKVEREEAPPAAPQTPQPAEPQPEQGDALLKAVYKSAQLLGIPEQQLRVTEGDAETTVRMPHSGDEMELALAGSVVEGQLELAGGTILRSEADNSGWVVVARYAQGNRKLRVRLGGGTPLAIVVDDFGMIAGAELQAFCREVPPEVTFAIIPGTPHAQEAMQLGHDTGHELMIHMPMQAMGQNGSASADELTVGMPATQIRERVQGWIDELPLCVGANNHQGSAFTASGPDITVALEVMRDNGLYFIDSRTYKDTKAYSTALKLGVPTAERRSFLDVPGITDADLDAKVTELNKLRQSNDFVVAITHCFPVAKRKHLLKLIQRAEAEGFYLVPASQVVHGEEGV